MRSLRKRLTYNSSRQVIRLRQKARKKKRWRKATSRLPYQSLILSQVLNQSLIHFQSLIRVHHLALILGKDHHLAMTPLPGKVHLQAMKLLQGLSLLETSTLYLNLTKVHPQDSIDLTKDLLLYTKVPLQASSLHLPSKTRLQASLKVPQTFPSCSTKSFQRIKNKCSRCTNRPSNKFQTSVINASKKQWECRSI